MNAVLLLGRDARSTAGADIDGVGVVRVDRDPRRLADAKGKLPVE